MKKKIKKKESKHARARRKALAPKAYYVLFDDIESVVWLSGKIDNATARTILSGVDAYRDSEADFERGEEIEFEKRIKTVTIVDCKTSEVVGTSFWRLAPWHNL